MPTSSCPRRRAWHEPIPHPPPWVAGLPLVGDRAQGWEDAIASGASGVAGRCCLHADDILKWLVGQAGSVGFVFVQFLLTVAISALMYAGVARRRGRRAPLSGEGLAGASGEAAVTLGGQAIRAASPRRRRHASGWS